jgi:glycosyltransferase involved in cell wall biosynthesis
MKIAFWGSARNIIPPPKTGGGEQSAYYLAKELTERGHEVTLYAAPGSEIKGAKTKEVSPFPTFIKTKHANLQERITSCYDLMALSDFFSSGEDKKYDLIYYTNYIFYDILPFAKWSSAPVVIRVNYPHDMIFPYLKNRVKDIDNVYYLPISHFIKTIMPGLSYLDVVYTALDFKDFPFSDKGGEYLLFIGRICPDKGADLAVRAALKSGKKLIMAGKVYEVHQDYFDKKIRPFIDNKQITYIGEADFETKIKLYQNALATLFPIQWNEPMGTVMLESMACGTPVIAFDRAAVREIIKDKESGFIVKDGSVEKMAAAATKASEMDRRQVRSWVEDNFSIELWAEKFEQECRQLLN